MHIGKLSIWFGTSPLKKWHLLPSCSYFDGGCYFKFSFYFLNYILEFSHPKKNKTIYTTLTSQKIDEILEDMKALSKSCGLKSKKKLNALKKKR